MDITMKMAQYRPMIEQALQDALHADVPMLEAYRGMMRYHLGWTDEEFRSAPGGEGKRVRPTICLLACEAAGGDIRVALPAAAAIEILHNFSLVHDDIEDNSRTRRGKPAVWTIWGVPQAINVGDALFALAHRLLSQLSDEGVPAETILAAIRSFDDACVALTEGQFLDMSFELQQGVTVEQYLQMVRGKTASLMGLATELGALLAGSPERAVAELAEFGRLLGMAFQIDDDVLGIWGDEALLGKSASSDILEKKKTLPVIYGLESSCGAQLQELYAQPSLSAQDLHAVLHLLDRAGARSYAEDMSRKYLERALQALTGSGLAPQNLVHLEALAIMLSGREH